MKNCVAHRCGDFFFHFFISDLRFFNSLEHTCLAHSFPFHFGDDFGCRIRRTVTLSVDPRSKAASARALVLLKKIIEY